MIKRATVTSLESMGPISVDYQFTLHGFDGMLYHGLNFMNVKLIDQKRSPSNLLSLLYFF